MDLNKHIITNDDNKPFHSNGYAQIAVGNRVGSTAAHVSFNQRQQIDRNRRIIYGYNRSAIGNTYGASRTKNNFVAEKTINVIKAPSLQQQNSIKNSPTPPPQRYNPFA